MYEEEDLDNFEPVAKIKVIGVGGAGNNAVNRMIDENIQNVEFYVANTDRQSLATSKVANNRIVLGDDETRGLGAGGDPAVGRAAAEKSRDKIRAALEGADMVFIAAGMGKGTGTGAAPVVASIAKELGALTVAIVTRPFTFEGQVRTSNAIAGLDALKEVTDSIIIVSNDKLLYDAGNAEVEDAFKESDRILARSVQTVSDLILVPGKMNLDFADVRSTLQNGGIALIGYGQGEGKNKAADAAEAAINSPLLEASISGARRAICAVTCGNGVTLYEAQQCVNIINEQAGGDVDIKFGVTINPNLNDTIVVSVLAADFTEEYDYHNTQGFIPTDSKDLGMSVEPKPQTLESIQQSVARAEADAPEKDEDSIVSSFMKNFETILPGDDEFGD